MRKRTTVTLAIFAVFLLLTLLFVWWTQQRYVWQDSVTGKAYHENWEQPYGSLIFYRMLQGYLPERRFIQVDSSLASALPDTTAAPAAYVFIGEGMHYDSAETEQLLRFVAAGNTALLISKSLPQRLIQRLLGDTCAPVFWEDYEYYLDTFVQMQLKRTADTVSLFFAVRNEPVLYHWCHIRMPEGCGALSFDTLGLLDSLPNFIALPLGMGKILLHSTPVAFSNYQLLRPAMRRYVEEVVAELPNGDLYWDADNRVPEREARVRNNSSRSLPDDHPLAYILRQPALAWAWYLLIGMAVSYLLFQAKRRRQVVPVLARNENSSYEFISTIANLHFREKNYRQICYQMMRLFVAQVRERYALPVQFDPETGVVQIDNAFIPKLAQRSETPEARLNDLFRQFTAVVQFEPDEDMMVELNRSIDAFWKHAK